MSDFLKLYVKDAERKLTPVYVPGLTFSFIINNGGYFTDPNWALLDLQVLNTSTNQIVATNFTKLQRAFPFGVSDVYQLYARFAFPPLPNGEYRFVVYQYGTDSIKLQSNVILVENDITNTTMEIVFWHDATIYGFQYPAISSDAQAGQFKQIFRLPITEIDKQFESDKATYRNVSDRRLRVLRSYRDTNVKFEARNFDDSANEALSAVLEHRFVEIDGKPIAVKTALTIATNTIASLNKSSFEGYAYPENRNGIFGEYGDRIIYCGDSSFNPNNIIEPQ